MSGFTYKEQYAVVVMCKDEKEQKTVYNRLKAEGFKLKVVWFVYRQCGLLTMMQERIFYENMKQCVKH